MSRSVLPSKSRDGAKRFLLQAAEVTQRVVAVAGALAAEDQSRFPAGRRRPQQLRLAGRGLAGIEVVRR